MATKTLDTVDIIKALVASLTPTVIIESIVDNGDGTYTLTMLDTFWLQPVKKITIDGNVYRIVSFVINESLIIKDVTQGAGIPTATTFDIPAPLFYHGVTQNAANEQSKKKLSDDRNPFVWLYEVLLETTITDVRVPWGRRSTPRLFFMNEARSKDWLPSDHKINVIEPMRQMVELFISKIEDKPALYGELLDYDSTARANWGKFIVDKGSGKRWFNDDLSGHQVGFEFLMSKTLCDKRITVFACEIGVIAEGTNPTTVGGSDGTATANDTGGQGAITYLWSTGDGSIPAGEEIKKTATGLTAGTYTVLVTDGITSNCTDMDSTILTDDIFDPNSIAGIQLWLDAADASTINGGSPVLNDPVSLWADKSVNGFDATQLTGSSQFIWKVDRLESDGSDFMTLGKVISKLPAHTVFIVHDPTDITGVAILAEGTTNLSINSGISSFILSSSKYFTAYGDSTNFRGTLRDIVVSATKQLFSHRYGVGDILEDIQVNKTPSTELDGGGTATSIGGTKFDMSIGKNGEFNGSFYTGDFYEIVVYNTDLSDADRTLVSDYLVDKHSL